MAWLMAAALLAMATPAGAQPRPDPPGPYVIDVRGALIGVPSAGAFFPPPDPASEVTLAAVPSRAFGFDVGGHVLPLTLGGSRLGFGVNMLRARASLATPDVSAVVTAVTPQLSFNFGTADGWSYLSAGYGTAGITSRLEGAASEADSGFVGAVNIGGGVRWFLKGHLAAGFDVRFHRLGKGRATPRATIVGLAVGISLR